MSYLDKKKKELGLGNLSNKKDLAVKRIRNRISNIAVFGLGYVGLPEAATIASAGFHVTGVDVNSKIIENLSKGCAPVSEPLLADLVKRVTEKGLLNATLDASLAAKRADIVVICVQTPLKENKTADLSFVRAVCEVLAKSLVKNKIVIIESTLPPNATKTILLPILEQGSGFKLGSDFWLAHCPERITPGKALNELIANDRIIGGCNSESSQIVAEFYKLFVKGNIYQTDSTTAEIAKLAENTFRDVNIAFANQLALVCEDAGVDVLDVIRLSNTHPRVHIHQPGPGVGGPCLTKDPYLLLYSSKFFGPNLIEVARQTNDNMPKHLVNIIVSTLGKQGKNVQKSKIAILGTAYKKDVDDPRLSPAQTIIEDLVHLGAQVIVYDPYCEETFGGKNACSLEEAVTGADCLILSTDHSIFLNLPLYQIKSLMRNAPIIVDGRRIIKSEEAERLGFVYKGIGFGRDKRSTKSAEEPMDFLVFL